MSNSNQMPTSNENGNIICRTTADRRSIIIRAASMVVLTFYVFITSIFCIFIPPAWIYIFIANVGCTVYNILSIVSIIKNLKSFAEITETSINGKGIKTGKFSAGLDKIEDVYVRKTYIGISIKDDQGVKKTHVIAWKSNCEEFKNKLYEQKKIFEEMKANAQEVSVDATVDNIDFTLDSIIEQYRSL